MVKLSLISTLLNSIARGEQLLSGSQIRTRSPIERCFSVGKEDFPFLSYSLRLKTKKVEAIVVPCAVLHNIALNMHDNTPQ